MPAPLPRNEGARLEDVSDLAAVGGDFNGDLDAIVDMARMVAGTPISLSSIVDDTDQYFLARRGIHVDQTPRSISFCSHAIAAGHDPFVVHDARNDPRFADNPLVTGPPHIVFYAGFPLVTSRGNAVGSLCVIDVVPRQLDDHQMSALARLASQTSAILDSQRQHHTSRDIPVSSRRVRTGGADPVLLRDPQCGLLTSAGLIRDVEADGHLSTPSSAIVLLVDDADPTGRAMAEGAISAIAARVIGAAPPTARVGRVFGGFLVILPGFNTRQTREAIDALLRALRRPVYVSHEITITVRTRCGSAVALEASGVGASDLIDAADQALSHAGGGEYGLLVLTGGRQNMSREHAALLRADLPDALVCGEIVLHYQPLTGLATGEVIGAEALARWTHPMLGAIPPDDFIPLIWESGLILDFDRFVLDFALCDMARGALRGNEVAINLSLASFNEGVDLIVAAALSTHHVDPSQLVLEVNERASFEGNDEGVEALVALSKLGVRIAIDDFGAGITSVSQLLRLPLARVKFDKSLIADLDGDEPGKAEVVIRGLSGLVSGLGLEAVAEGIESENQLQAVRRCDIDFAQGFLMGYPVRAAAGV